ncbi:lipopolysaccharide biosynthesis protein [Roseibium sp. MMSF_3412]|uniref:lipopolysaccharide biosynthesis protein n=1 Tax=Roseibium sp. MMSF_3412 TaxID=3046712 RepID=UPI00273D1D3E|nr:oligosaccharide flippase family protein [Roseibium sp. MMSF_3412]
MSVINTSAGMLSMLMGFVCSIIVARTLGVEGTGVVAYALWFMSVATVVSDFGMPQAALRFIARDTNEESGRSPLFRNLLKRFVLTTGFMACGIAVYALWQQGQGNIDGAIAWAATIVLFLSYAYASMAINAAQGLGQFDRTASMTLVGCIVQPVFVFAGAFIFGPAGAILGHATRHLPQAFDLGRYFGRSTAPDRKLPKDVALYARNNWFSGSIFALFGARIELAVIGFFFTFTQVGYYSIGLTMSGMVVQFAVFSLAFVIPQFGVLHDQKDERAIATAFEGTIRWLAIVIAPVAIGGASIAPVLIPLVFGEDFQPAVWPAVILLGFSIAQAMSAVISRAILARDRSADELRMTIAWCAITTVALLLIVPAFGQMGAAVARAAASLLLLLILGIYCRRVLKLRLPLVALLKCICAALLCAGTATLVLSRLDGIAGLLLAVCAAALVYLAALLVFRTVPRSEYEPVLSDVKDRLRGLKAT